MTEKPDYVLNFPRQKNTEIKKIGNNWYLYERFGKYDPAIKRSRKISGKGLGKHRSLCQVGIPNARPEAAGGMESGRSRYSVSHV